MTVPLQPLLDQAVVALRAPTQVWSDDSGDAGAAPIHGVYHGDVRHVRGLALACADSPVEWISRADDGPSRIVFAGLLRGLDDRWPDPKVRLRRVRTVSAGRLHEEWTIASHLPTPLETALILRVSPDFALLHEVKSGAPQPRTVEVEVTDAAATATCDAQRFTLTAAGAALSREGDDIVATWPVHVGPRGTTTVSFALDLADDALVVQAAQTSVPWDAREVAGAASDLRLARWLEVALGDLDALRLALPDHPSDEFFAAGAPWFFTLFGRDSLWAARLSLPVDARMAASTLRVLARLQGTVDDPSTAQEPGKILHELRATTLELPGEGIVLPPRYYGSVDATPLWVCLLADAWKAGMPEAEIRALLPTLFGALRWIVDEGDSDGDGFLDYVDRTGQGLANQGWKDSGDSIQWRDGQLAQGPIALCEVQAYAYEAVRAGADLIEALGADNDGDDAPDPRALRAWAAALRARFAEAFWVQTPEGRYPAVALDRDKKPVDTLTSNIGHLLGTGILDPADEAHVTALLRTPSMSSGYGIRTMSTGAAGYWPLSYHGGSVWMHDTAITVHGMLRAGLTDAAREVVGEMLDAAEGFAFRVPELHAGDAAADSPTPTPYPAACRPQAWSAAAAVTALQAERAGA